MHDVTYPKHPHSVRGNVVYRRSWSEVPGWVTGCLGSLPEPVILWQVTWGKIH